MRVSDVKGEPEALGDYEFGSQDVIRRYLFLWIGESVDVVLEVDVVVLGFGSKEEC